MGGGREGKGREGEKEEGLACEQGLLLPGLGGGLGWVGWGSERPCSQARRGEGFAARHNFFLLTFIKFLTQNKHF